MTEAVHSSFSSPEKLIPMAEEPINVFKNQILLSLGNKSYIWEIVFSNLSQTHYYRTNTQFRQHSTNSKRKTQSVRHKWNLHRRGNLRETTRNLSTI